MRLGSPFAINNLQLAIMNDFDPIVNDIENVSATHPADSVAVMWGDEGERVFGLLMQADGDGAKRTVVLLHGFPGVEKHGDLAHVFLRAGCNVLLFSYRGAWGSEGVYKFEHVLADTQAAVDWLRENAAEHRIDTEQIVLVGHSMGGWAGLMVGAADHAVQAVCAFAGFNVGAFGRDVLEDEFMIGLAAQSWEAEAMALNAEPLDLLNEVKANEEAWDVCGQMKQFARRPVLLIAGSKDEVALPFMHHEPMVAAGQAAGVALTTCMLADGHSFYGTRLAMIRTILDWIDDL